MSQAELDRQVSRHTGESLREIRRRGFSLLMPQLSVFDPDADELEPQMVDWDRVESDRFSKAA